MTMPKYRTLLGYLMSLCIAFCACAINANAQVPVVSILRLFRSHWRETSVVIGYHRPCGKYRTVRSALPGACGRQRRPFERYGQVDAYRCPGTASGGRGIQSVDHSLNGWKRTICVQVAMLSGSSFSNNKNSIHTEVSQSFPWPGSPPLTGAVAVETLHYSLVNPTHFSDATYRLRFQVPYNVQAGSQSIFFDFSMYALQDISDESWGLDNVAVAIRQASTQ